jgi:hypothetical protein
MKQQTIDLLRQFGIADDEYTVTKLPWGEIIFTAREHTVSILPDIKRKTVQIDRAWLLDRFGSENVALVAATALATILRQQAP